MTCQEHKRQYCRPCNYGFCSHNARKCICKFCSPVKYKEYLENLKQKRRSRNYCSVCDAKIWSSTPLTRHRKTYQHQNNLRKHFTHSKIRWLKGGSVLVEFSTPSLD